jgi:hypothetical protein
MGRPDQPRYRHQADHPVLVSDDLPHQPQVDQDRYYLLQDLGMTNEFSKFGFVRGVGVSNAANPCSNLTGYPYVTDGLRLAVLLAPQRQLAGTIQFLGWERPAF